MIWPTIFFNRKVVTQKLHGTPSTRTSLGAAYQDKNTRHNIYRAGRAAEGAVGTFFTAFTIIRFGISRLP